MGRDEFYLLLTAYKNEAPQQRHGQAAFNVAYRLFPEEVNKVRGTSLDPFYDDTRVVAFLDALGIV